MKSLLAACLLALSGCGASGGVTGVGGVTLLDPNPVWWKQTENIYAVTYPNGVVNLWIGVRTARTAGTFPPVTDHFAYALVFTGQQGDTLVMADSALTNCSLAGACKAFVAFGDTTAAGVVVVPLSTPQIAARDETLYVNLERQ